MYTFEVYIKDVFFNIVRFFIKEIYLLYYRHGSFTGKKSKKYKIIGSGRVYERWIET